MVHSLPPPASKDGAGSLPAPSVVPLDPLTEWGHVSRATAALIQAVLEKERAAKMRRTATEATRQLDAYQAAANEARAREAGRAVRTSWGDVDEAMRRRLRVLKNRPADRLTNFHSRQVIRRKIRANGYRVGWQRLKATLLGQTDPRLSLLVAVAEAGGASVATLATALGAAAADVARKKMRAPSAAFLKHQKPPRPQA